MQFNIRWFLTLFPININFKDGHTMHIYLAFAVTFQKSTLSEEIIWQAYEQKITQAQIYQAKGTHV